MKNNTPATLSFWERESFFDKADVTIIGSGIVGLSAAICLKEMDKSLKINILERGTIPTGASTRNAGFACFGSVSELLDDLKTHSEDTVLELISRRFLGLQRLRQRVGDAKMDYWECGGYELFKHDEANFNRDCLAGVPYLNHKLEKHLGIKQIYQLADHQIKSFGFKGVAHLILNQSEGQLHTGKMMTSLLDIARQMGVFIYNGIEIDTIEDHTQEIMLHTAQGWSLGTDKILVTTNGFARQLLPQLDVQAARNQVCITQPIPNLRVRGTFHYDKGYFYFRNVGDRILLGGGRNLDKMTEATDQFGTTTLIQNALKELLANVILPEKNSPEQRIESWWSGILGIGDQKKPIIEMLSPRLGVAVRMGGMGVAIGSLVGEDAAKMLINA